MKKEYNEDEIRSVNWTEHVRLRPQMYFNGCFEEGTLDAIAYRNGLPWHRRIF